MHFFYNKQRDWFSNEIRFRRVDLAKLTFHYWVICHTKSPTITASISMIWAIHFVVCSSLIIVAFFVKLQWTIYQLDDQLMKRSVWFKHSNIQTVMVKCVQLDGVQEPTQSFQIQKKKQNISQRTIESLRFNDRKKIAD